ncbi:MAG: hypothetical protein DRH17_06690 [Deltaproteobacteria bacterium]|nr:MAG: hypothetical protein DRH17_06690 [Deltaproteobacteria bacterium]
MGNMFPPKADQGLELININNITRRAMVVLQAEEVKRLATEGLPDWIKDEPELRRSLRDLSYLD